MENIFKEVADELNLPKKVVERAYKAYWLFIRQTISNLPLNEDLTEEKFNSLQTSFNLPYLGKLSCNRDKWLSLKKVINNKAKRL